MMARLPRGPPSRPVTDSVPFVPDPGHCLAVASFSLRLPAHDDLLVGDHDKSIWPEQVDKYLHATGVLDVLRSAFADPLRGDSDSVLGDGFDLHAVGSPLGDDAATCTDLPLTLLRPERPPAHTVAFSVDDLQLPGLFSDVSAGPFERDSWRPALLAGPAFEKVHLAHVQDAHQIGTSQHGAYRPVNANDTLVAWHRETDEEESVLVRYLAAAFGQRRSYLFAPSFATRIHNIFLPLGRLISLPNDADTQGSDSTKQQLVIPFVTLVGSAAHRSFRRTVTMSLIILPVQAGKKHDSLGKLRLRSFDDHEVVEIAAQWDWSPARLRNAATQYDLDGSLGTYLTSSSHGHAVDRSSFTMRSLAESLLVNTAASVCLGRHPSLSRRRWSPNAVESYRNQLAREALQSLHIAKTSTILPWFDPVAGLDPSSQADTAAASLANLLFSNQRTPTRDAMLARFALPESPIPEGPYVGAYYVSTHAALVYSYVRTGTSSQRRDPIWMAAYVSYLGVALSSIRSALLALDREVDRAKDSPDQLLSTAETLVELEEVFDLQFAVKTHRTYYEELRRRDGALDDYEWLVKKVELLRDESSLRRQHTENRRVLLATVLIGILTVVLAIPNASDLLVGKNDTSTRHALGIASVAVVAVALAVVVGMVCLPAIRATKRWVVSRWVMWKTRRLQRRTA